MSLEHSAGLTVGMPVHNAMPFLPAAVASLLAQTYADFTVLVIVDGSTDESLEYLLSIEDSRLRVIQQPHRGLTATLNRMLEMTESPWLVRQDADDLSTPDRLATIARAIQSNPEAGMFYSHAAYYPVKKSVGLFRSTRGTPEQIRRIARSGYVPAICHPSAVLHVEKTRALGGYREGLDCEDADLWWRMALAHDIHFIPEVLLYFRQNAASLSSRRLHEQALHGLYVQYLLLSTLDGRTPAKLAAVADELETMLACTPLKAKELLRVSNIALGQSDFVEAARCLLASIVASPSYFIGRLRDEWFPPTAIANGLSPRLYAQRKDALWPQPSST
jgi:glycosyltransferase involved in cell wall biosynthesis